MDDDTTAVAGTWTVVSTLLVVHRIHCQNVLDISCTTVIHGVFYKNWNVDEVPPIGFTLLLSLRPFLYGTHPIHHHSQMYFLYN